MRTLPRLLTVALLGAMTLAGCHRAGDDTAMAGTEAAEAETAAAGAEATSPEPATLPASLTVAGSGDDLYLADASGRALYVLEGDDGKRCAGDCLNAWQPLTGTTPVAGAEPVQAPMISSISHDDGSMHVTYNGMPLYYFARDTGPGMTLGQDVEDAWGHWYLVRPTGELVPASFTATAVNHEAGAAKSLPGDAGGVATTAAGADARAPATTPPGSDPPPATNKH